MRHNDIIAALRAAREARELRLEDVAPAAGLATKAGLSKWESGQRTPDVDQLQQWAKAVGYRLTIVIAKDSPGREAEEIAAAAAALDDSQRVMVHDLAALLPQLGPRDAAAIEGYLHVLLEDYGSRVPSRSKSSK